MLRSGRSRYSARKILAVVSIAPLDVSRSGQHRGRGDLQLSGTPSAAGAYFYPSGLAHSVVSGTGWEPTPWRATQRSAWDALKAPHGSRPSRYGGALAEQSMFKGRPDAAA